VRRILISTRKLPPHVVRALQAAAVAHRLELLELEIRVRVVPAASAPPAVAGARAATIGVVRAAQSIP
jgi:hypothetical protein